MRTSLNLSAETVNCYAVFLKGVYNVHYEDGLATRKICIVGRVADQVLKELMERAAGLLVNEAADALDAATASEAPDCGLGDALNVVTKNLAFTPFAMPRLQSTRR